ncbi:hypothetical protein HPB48_014226 [Haemaphysalis longicornis]|uniref:AAA+ ATPase domain-containing protein n=1 Tax=Haemaphysalis longicornis TaxID=44386 RepID=A0A9J6FKJ7_HAELO|nr:hypothetical protein HPB48_014226 [Haemaphysalis longicornis]
MKSEVMHIMHEIEALKKIKANDDKIKLKKVLPYLVSTLAELPDLDPEELGEEDGARVNPTLSKRWSTEHYSDIGRLDKLIQELVEAVVLPVTHKGKFAKIGLDPNKGALLYGPPGTGKTLMARAWVAQTKSTFLKLAAPSVVQTFIGDGAKLVRDALALAKELDAIGTKRFDSEETGCREVQRTMLELLNQLDGFSSSGDVRVIAATNRVDIYWTRPKIEFPDPDEKARARIMHIHSRKTNYQGTSTSKG